jgi:hypothetical protein
MLNFELEESALVVLNFSFEFKIKHLKLRIFFCLSLVTFYMFSSFVIQTGLSPILRRMFSNRVSPVSSGRTG